MPLKVTFELSDKDLRYFRRMMAEVRESAKDTDEAEIVEAARKLRQQVALDEVPEFVSIRVAKLDGMIEMLDDAEWALSGSDRTRVVRALAYFAEPDDLIPDKIPGLGFLDDAIMVELVVEELRHELEAYHDFCHFRHSKQKLLGKGVDRVTRERWLAARRKQLQTRMRRRRTRRRSRPGGGGRKSPISLW